MPSPVHFPEVNIVFGKGQPEYQELPAFVGDAFEVTTQWQFSVEEMERLAANDGKFYLTQLTFGSKLQPIMPTMEKPPSMQKKQN